MFAGAVSCRALALVRQWKWLGLGLLHAGLSYRKTKTDNLATLKHRLPSPDQTNPQTQHHALISHRVTSIEGSSTDSDTPTLHTIYDDTRIPPPPRDRRLLAGLLACSPRFPAAHLDPATPTSINNQAQRRRSIVNNTRLHTFSLSTTSHATAFTSSLTRASRNDGQRCSRPALSPTSH